MDSVMEFLTDVYNLEVVQNLLDAIIKLSFCDNIFKIDNQGNHVGLYYYNTDLLIVCVYFHFSIMSCTIHSSSFKMSNFLCAIYL